MNLLNLLFAPGEAVCRVDNGSNRGQDKCGCIWHWARTPERANFKLLKARLQESGKRARMGSRLSDAIEVTQALRSSKNSEGGLTLVINKWSRARVQAT